MDDQFAYRPDTYSTDPGQILRDMTEKHLRKQQRLGRAPQSIGVTRPMPPIETPIDSHRAMESWEAEQSLTYGGYGADARDTKASDSYSQRRWDFLSKEEAIRESAYDDATGKAVAGSAKGNVTVGVGFNMERPDAPSVFKKVLGFTQSQFDQLKAGKTGLSPTQIRKLFDYTADEAEARVARVFQGVPLREHQRLALVSMAFNGPQTIGPRLAAAVRSGDAKAMITEVLHNSGAGSDPRLKGRRQREALMLMGHSNRM